MSLTDANFDFFKDITEVSGYVRVHGPLPGLTRLPFPNLRIIRGENSLTSEGDNRDKEYSLYIYNVPSLTSLGLTALQGRALSIACLRHLLA